MVSKSSELVAAVVSIIPATISGNGDKKKKRVHNEIQMFLDGLHRGEDEKFEFNFSRK